MSGLADTLAQIWSGAFLPSICNILRIKPGIKNFGGGIELCTTVNIILNIKFEAACSKDVKGFKQGYLRSDHFRTLDLLSFGS